MCTVTYLPLPSEGFVLTSTRDEKNIRQPALPPELYMVEGHKLCYPKDPDAGGTWIIATDGGYSLSLLNGGFKIHDSKPPYRRSRGLLVLDFFKYNEINAFLDTYIFQGIEPFTLLVAGKRSLDEIRWDGTKIHHTEINPEIPGIWSSVTLYPDDVIKMREEWFHNWLLLDPTININEAVNFHKKAGTGDMQNDIMMSRKEVRTVSITSILRSTTADQMQYEDVISGKIYSQNISEGFYNN